MIEPLNPARRSSYRIDPVGVRLELVSVRLLGPRMGHPLREQRDDVHALGRERGSRSLGMHASSKGRSPRARARLLERLLEGRDPWAISNPPRDVRGPLRRRVELRKPGKCEVDLHHTATGRPALDIGDEVARELDAVELVQERELWVGCSDHVPRRELFPAREATPSAAAVAVEDLVYRSVGSDLGAERLAAGAIAAATAPIPPRVAPRPTCRRRRRR